jgi:hypothetical protein
MIHCLDDHGLIDDSSGLYMVWEAKAFQVMTVENP